MTKPSETYIKGINHYMETHWLRINGHLDHERHQNRIKYTGSFCVGTTVEIGAADGTSTDLIAKTNKDITISGVEPTDAGYSAAIEKHPNIKFYKAFAEELPFKDGEFDTVLLPEVIEHCEDPIKVLRECWRVAKKRFIVTHPVNIAGQKNDPTHVRYYTFNSMASLLGILFNLPIEKVRHYGLDRTGQIVQNAKGNERNVFFGITVIEKEKI